MDLFNHTLQTLLDHTNDQREELNNIVQNINSYNGIGYFKQNYIHIIDNYSLFDMALLITSIISKVMALQYNNGMLFAVRNSNMMSQDYILYFLNSEFIPNMIKLCNRSFTSIVDTYELKDIKHNLNKNDYFCYLSPNKNYFERVDQDEYMRIIRMHCNIINLYKSLNLLTNLFPYLDDNDNYIKHEITSEYPKPCIFLIGIGNDKSNNVNNHFSHLTNYRQYLKDTNSNFYETYKKLKIFNYNSEIIRYFIKKLQNVIDYHGDELLNNIKMIIKYNNNTIGDSNIKQFIYDNIGNL